MLVCVLFTSLLLFRIIWLFFSALHCICHGKTGEICLKIPVMPLIYSGPYITLYIELVMCLAQQFCVDGKFCLCSSVLLPCWWFQMKDLKEILDLHRRIKDLQRRGYLFVYNSHVYNFMVVSCIIQMFHNLMQII